MRRSNRAAGTRRDLKIVVRAIAILIQSPGNPVARSIRYDFALVLSRDITLDPQPQRSGARNPYRPSRKQRPDTHCHEEYRHAVEKKNRIIERSAQLLPLRVPTIELAGGSVRCMLAGIHLARR